MNSLTYSERAALSVVPIAKQLFKLMDEKKTNLMLSADVTKADELLNLASLLGSSICGLKTHIDMIEDFTPQLSRQLIELSKIHQFVIFEDRKFADIGNTVKHQYAGGIYRIADWAHLTNAHIISGPGIIQGLKEIGKPQNRGLILLAEMSSDKHLMDEAYQQKTLKLAEEASDFVIGFITQRALSQDPRWINFTPGVKLSEGFDSLGQKYITPQKAIFNHGSDVIIVGRGIISAKDPLAEASLYRENAWEAYLRRCRSEQK